MAEAQNQTASTIAVEVAPVRPGEELNWSSIDAFVRTQVPGLTGQLSVMQFPNGSANLTYLLRYGNQELDNQVIGQGAWNATGSPIDFNAREDVELRFPFRLEPRQALAGLFDFTAAQPSLEMRGELNVRVLFIPLRLPFEVNFVRAATTRKDQQSY